MVGDDTGDTISLRNPHFSKRTAVYWAWKNYAALGNPDYIGLAHYRRFLAFASDEENGYFRIPAFRTVKEDHYDERIIVSVVARHDLIVRSPIPIACRTPEENGGLGFLAERLTGLFIMHCQRKGGISVKHVPGIDLV